MNIKSIISYFLLHPQISFLALLTLFLLNLCPRIDAYVDYSYCKKYQSDPIDRDGVQEEWGTEGYPLLYMGETYEKKFYITTKNLTTDFFNGAFYVCERFGLRLASIKTACEYGILERWFMDKFPTDYSCWVSGMRFGDYFHPIWMTSGEPLDLSQFGVDFIGGPYPPGGYDPIPYPWVNCLSVSRNCPEFTGAPTNPCEQSPTYPELQFMWEDCRISSFRVICEETSYTKQDTNTSENEIEGESA